LDAAPAPTEPTAVSPTLEAVQEVLDALVRPALQSDGGDIELLGVEDGRITVRLVGACGSCPSSTVTMRAGVERLLAAELPGFRELIQAPAEA
jgi:Fe-S cluster biogenesis protein NfuA